MLAFLLLMLSSLRLLFARILSGLFAPLLLASGLAPARAQAPPYAWAVGVGTTTLGQIGTADRHHCDVTKMAVTAAGQTYLTGSFERSVEFGATVLTSAGAQDAFLAKFDANGNALWAVRAGDRGDDAAFGVAVDAVDNAYVTGYFRYAATFGAFTLTGPGLSVGYVAKYNPQGVCQWAVPLVQQGGNGYSLAVDANGDVVLAGTFTSQTAQFGATTLQMVGVNENGFVAKLSGQGVWRWAVRTGSRAGNLVLDPVGNVYCAGNFGGTTAFGPFTVATNGGQDGFVGKLDPAGNWLWVKNAGGPGYDYGAGVGVDYAGNVFVAGGFGVPSATFGARTIPNRGGGNFDAYVAKLDPNGNFLWAEGMGGTDNDVASDLVVDDDGSAYVIGSYQDYGPGATFGTVVMPNLGRQFGQCFVAKTSAAGSFEWVATSSSGAGEFGQCVALDHRGGVYAAGFHTGSSIGFGGTTLVGNPGAHTGFLAKIGDSPLAKVVGLNPPQGAAGTPVTVRGARLTGATAVYFNGVPAASFAVTSPTTLTAVAPPGVATGPVSVQTPAGAGPAGLVFQVGTATSTTVLRATGTGCWPNPVPAGERLQLEQYGSGMSGFSAQATLYTLLGQPAAVCSLSPTGEVALGKVRPGHYVLVVSTPGQGVSRYSIQVQ